MLGDDEFDDFFSAGDLDPDPDLEEGIELKVPPRLGLLKNLTAEEFTQVARAAKLKHYEPGAVVFEQGDEADRFYILVDGEVDVIRGGEILAHLGPGSFFGESALLMGGNRSATVACKHPSSVWSVDYATFNSVVSHQLMADEDVKREVESRLEGSSPEHYA